MRIAWTYIAIGFLTLASAAVIVGGEPAKAELRFAESATTAVAASDALGWLTADATPARSSAQ